MIVLFPLIQLLNQFPFDLMELVVILLHFPFCLRAQIPACIQFLKKTVIPFLYRLFLYKSCLSLLHSLHIIFQKSVMGLERKRLFFCLCKLFAEKRCFIKRNPFQFRLHIIQIFFHFFPESFVFFFLLLFFILNIPVFFFFFGLLPLFLHFLGLHFFQRFRKTNLLFF